MDRETLVKHETLLLRTAVCPVITTYQKKKQLYRSAAVQVLGWGQARGDGCRERRQGGSVSRWGLACPPSSQQPLRAPLHHSSLSIVREQTCCSSPPSSSCLYDGCLLEPYVAWIFPCRKALKWFLNDWQGLPVASKSHLSMSACTRELQLRCCSSAGWSFIFHLEKALDLSERCLAVKETEL